MVRKRGDLEAVVSRIASGEARILVGTQMVTKGHDFPSVTLVVVLNADQGLFSTDFRAPERVAQTIIQVAGRAGRGNETRRGADPDRVSRSSAAAKPAEATVTTGFARTALAEREAADWPPFAHVAALRASATGAGAGGGFPARGARQLAGRVRRSEVAGTGAGRHDETRGALPRAAADRGVAIARRCIGC